MNTGTELGGAESFFNRKTIATALLAAGPIGIATLTPLVWPRLDHRVGLTIVILCGLGMLAAVILLWSAHWQRAIGSSRRWTIVGMGQGWIEARVRNDAGDQIVTSWNAGAGADAISLRTTFRKRSGARQSAIVEMICDVDGTTFEWDVPDAGTAEFALNANTWRDVEAMKIMLAALREGNSLAVSVPTLGLSAKFTLNGAFDTLEEAATLGEEPQATKADVAQRRI